MGVITQTSETSDTIAQNLSADYRQQIGISGNVGQVAFSVTSPDTSITVTASGEIVTAGELLLGTYLISGTMADLNGNSGTWAFTLTVVSSTSPGTGVTPFQSLSPTGLEIKVPFQIDPSTGGVAQLSNYFEILQQHVATIIMTEASGVLPGERLMLPNFGSPLPGSVFQPNVPARQALLAKDIRAAINKYEPSVTILSLNITTDPNQPEVMVINLNYSVAPLNDLNTLSVSTGGTITQVVAP